MTEADEIRPQEAAKRLGIHRAVLMNLLEEIDPVTGKPYIVSRRPSRGVIWISLASLTAHEEATRDAEFWEIRKRLNEVSPREREKILATLRPKTPPATLVKR